MASPVVRRAPYKDFLQPCTQRRFASVLGWLLAFSLVEALFVPRLHLSWSLFPLTAVRTLLVFGCVVFVVVLRIAHPHVGIRTTNSPFDTFKQNALSLSASETILTYTLSAFLFSQVYLSCAADYANLPWVTYHSGDRARLNERAVFFTLSLTLLGTFEGTLHMWCDYDKLILGLVKENNADQGPDAPSPKQEDAIEKFLKRVPAMVKASFTVSVSVALANYAVLYSFLLRNSAWGWAMTLLRPFYNLPKTNIPPASAPWSVWMLGRTVLAGFLLCLLFGVSNVAFTNYLAREPLKNGQPLTSESKDPNGSLLNGLKSKKARISSFAMWELALIARDFDVRRKAIFEDIDRKDGPMWSQIYVICLGAIKALEKRIDDYGKPPAPSATAAELASQTKPSARVVEPPTSANIWQPAPPPKTLRDSLGKLVADVTKSPGKKPADTLVPFAKKTVADVRDSLLTKQQQENLSRDGAVGGFHWALQQMLGWPVLGWPFQQRYSRRVATAVLGTPYGDFSLYVNSAFTLSRLAVASLNEDNYGNVHRDVPTIIRTLTTVIKKLEIFKDNYPIHWTDVQGIRECGHVDEVLNALKEALGRVVVAFEKYSTDLRLNRTDIRLAKEAAEKPGPVPLPPAPKAGDSQPEMVQVH
ncbi:hypothetical protein JX265_012167 [Neoarthrinium moseri]|uniref:Nuclear envelope protein n=1 Tax=Neoarthrinium moseri TaxID=1658444 RepID=A0A9Q0AIV5_9PEZI|nr:hypothetical protein JX266_010614 [Neoarthrinium moseri]KAI1855722.1 hypothetical protein JX265_012167 [Neoarthrinium moseri]